MGGQRALQVVVKEGEDSKDENSEVKMNLGSYGRPVKIVEDAPEEIMLLWGLQQPTVCKPNSFVHQSSHSLRLDACGHCLSIFQSPSSLSTPGVTGAVMWDSGVVLAKFVEHAAHSGLLIFQDKKVVELGSGCGLVGCIAALLGARVILTDLPDRLRLLRKNVEENLRPGDMRGTAAVCELTWGDCPDPEIIEPIPDYVLGSDVIYSEEAVGDLLATLGHVCGMHTTVILAGELRNDTVLEFFMEAALKEFLIGRVDETEWHPDYRSKRVAMYILVKKVDKEVLM